MADATQKRKETKFLFRLEAWLEAPMFVLALVWLYLFIVELTGELSSFQETLVLIIWVLFLLEFLLKLYLAPKKISYLRHNWIAAIALAIPALRVFRLVRALSILSSARVVSIGRFVRALTSANRFVTDLKEAQGARSREMNCGIIACLSNSAQASEIKLLAEQLIRDVRPELETATGIEWQFDYAGETLLNDDSPRMAAEFLPTAGRAMAEGPYDLLLVLTDVGLISRTNKSVAGLASPVTRIAVASLRKLQLTGRGVANLPLQHPDVRWNLANLTLHLTGHLSGLKESADKGSVLARFQLQKDAHAITGYNMQEREYLRKAAPKLPEREMRGGMALSSFIFHLIMGFRHIGKVIPPLFRNKSIFLALALPGLATAAVAPALLLVFTAEIWDVGINMANGKAILFSVLSVLFASIYLIYIQNLFLPKKEDYIITEHLAVANVVIFCSILLACIGLFLILGLVMLLIEIYIFPDGLMLTWLTIERTAVTLADQIRLAAFISAIGTVTGALAGGLDQGSILRHLALFRKNV